MTGKMKRENTLSKNYDRKISCDCGKDIDYAKCIKPKEVVHKPAKIFCGQGGSAYFSNIDSPAAGVGQVTVDARDLCKPLIKIKFSSTVTLTSTDHPSEARLIFNLLRSCDNGEPILLDSWVYETFEIEDSNDATGLTTSFSFILCDCLNCSRLCDYFVEVSVDSLDDAVISVDNVQLQAIAHEKLLFCGQGMNAVFPGNNEEEPIIPNPSNAGLGQVTVNTRDLRKPVVEIEFSSIVNLIASDDNAVASLNFQLFRVCDDEEEPVLVNNWIYEVYEIDDSRSIRLSTSFSFTFCECLCPVKCCDYFVEVSVGGLKFIDTISVTDVHIAALAGESKGNKKTDLLFCGQGRSGAFTNTSMPPIAVGSVIADTRDICVPIVSIEFSSIVSFLASDDGIDRINDDDGAEGRLNFELFRACDDGMPVLLNNWTYEVNKIEDDNEDIRFIDSFIFNFCDDMACSGCCEYFVEVTLENILTAVILVDNVHMTALAGEGL